MSVVSRTCLLSGLVAGLVFGFLFTFAEKSSSQEAASDSKGGETNKRPVGAASVPRTLTQLGERFRTLDKDGDEKLTREEFDSPLFSFFNSNGDDVVTLEEARDVVTKKGVQAVETAIRRTRGLPVNEATTGSTAKKSADSQPVASRTGKSDETVESPASIRQGPVRVAPSEHKIGRLIDNWAISDMRGQKHQLSDLAKAKVTVIAFTNSTCPISRKYAPTLASIEDRFRNREVSFVYVNPSKADKVESVQRMIEEQGWEAPYLRDDDGIAAIALGATHTTDVMILDGSRTLMYRGAIDDQYGFGYTKDEPQELYLIDAIESVLAGSRPLIVATIAPGCPIEVQNVRKLDQNAKLTYHNRISRIVQDHCLTCHREGGVAPFSLSTYEEVVSQAAAIRQAVQRDIMPPWFARLPRKGEMSPFSNDCSLSETDKQDLLTWLAGERIEGDSKDAPLAKTFTPGWQIGKPDHIVQIPEPIAVKASGTMPYQNVVVETGLTETKYVSALEVKPTAREVVHHVLVFVLPPAKTGETATGVAEDNGDEDETSGFFAAYAPGYDALRFNDGYGKVLPAGSRLKFQIHYTPNGTATQDQSMLGIIFADQRPEHLVNVTGIAQPRFEIPPGADNHQVVATRPVPRDAQIMAFFPHMHLRGKAFKYELILPDGAIQTLLDIPRYDFNWQLSYRLAEPISAPAGSTIRATAWFDNSDKNPANPDPSRTVRWGPQTTDEMMIGYVEYHMDGGVLDRGGRLLGIASGLDFEALFKRWDKNKDNRLVPEELPERGRDRIMRLDSNGDGHISQEEIKRLKR